MSRHCYPDVATLSVDVALLPRLCSNVATLLFLCYTHFSRCRDIGNPMSRHWKSNVATLEI